MASDPALRATLARVLWIGGAQWSGKTSVAQLLAARHPLLLHAYDYHDARAHAQRSRDYPDRYPHRHAFLATLDRDPDAVWGTPTPEQMAADALHSFAEPFDMVLDDLRAMPDGPPILAEGWGLRPELVSPLLDSPRQAIFLVPTEQFRQHQLRSLARAAAFHIPGLGDPDRAQRNRIARDRLLAHDVVESAARLGLRVVMVDGSLDVAGLADLVEQQFRPYLPRWLC